MSNHLLVQHLDHIADYYTVASDPIRMRTFRSAARNVELLPFEIKQDNIKDVKFQGLGQSTFEVIDQFIVSKTSSRLSELEQTYPPIAALSLLTLFNFDLEYVYSLWEKHRVSSIQHLFNIPDARVQNAIKALDHLTLHAVPLPNHDYPILGDCIVHSAFGAGRQSIDSMAEKLVDLGDKHIFLADNLTSPNVLSGISESGFISQSESIRKAQLDHKIKIFQGLIIDLDKEGNPLTKSEQVLTQAEFVVLDIATHPHFNILKRLDRALRVLSKKENVIIDCLDVYSHLSLNKESFQRLLANHNPIVLLSSNDPLKSTTIAQFLQGVRLEKVALASKAIDFDQLDNLTESAKIAMKLNLTKKNIINCMARPFNISSSQNRVGVRTGTPPTQAPEERIKSSLEKVQRLRKMHNSLGSILKGEKWKK